MADGRASVNVEEVDVATLRTWMENGQATARQIVEAYVARIDAIDGSLRSVLEVNPDALAIADSLDRERAAGQVRGPLHGIPYGVKDLYDVMGLPTGAGTRLRAGEPPKSWVDEFREGLRELGYIEGQNVLIEFRVGTLDELPHLAEELVRSKVDVILASASSAGIAAKTATTSIPIVFTSLSHPVEIGLIKSLARPGGNITGLTVNAGATITKRLELLRELVPTLKQVAVLTHPAHPTDPRT